MYGVQPGLTSPPPFPSRLPLTSPLVFFHLGPVPLHASRLSFSLLTFSPPLWLFPKVPLLKIPQPCPDLLSLLLGALFACLSMSLTHRYEPPWFSTQSPHRSISAFLLSYLRERDGLSTPTQASKFTSFCIFVSI